MAPPPPPPLPPLAPDAAATPGWYYPLLLLLISCSALFSGLTLGLMSLDESQLQIIIAGDDRRQRMHAEKILPIRRRGNLLLCTLLLGNSLVNSMLAILVDGVSWLSGPMGVVASTTFILIFGEILPQSFCSRHGLAVGYYTSEVVKIAILALGLVAWPLSKLLDCSLGEELGTQYSRTELKHLFAMQAMQSQEAPGGGRAPRDATPGSSARLDTGLGASLSCATGASDEFGSVADGDVSIQPPHRGIRPAEVSWLCGVLSLSERTAEQIMTPLHDVFRVYDDDVLDFQLMRKIADSGHSRIPVLKRSADMIAPGQPRERTTAAHRPGAAAADGARGGVDAEVRQGEGQRKTQGGGNGGGNGGNGGAEGGNGGGKGRQADISRSDSEQSSKAGAGSGTGQRVGAAACGSTPVAPSRAQSQSASRPDSPPAPGASASSHPDRLTVSEWPDTCRSTDVVGLLSAKDLILMDPENAVPLSQMLKYCAREVVTAWFDTPVAQLFRDFKSGRSHLAMIQRVNDGATAGAGEGRAASAVCDPFYEVVGIVSLEDVLEELLGAEIVDESDVYTDNVTRGAVEGRRDEVRRREAWQNMLDPAQASALDLSFAEIEVIALYLAANVPLLSALPPVHLHALLRDSRVEVLPGGDSAPPLYTCGAPCAGCILVLHGRLHTIVQCGSESFEGELGPWSTLAVASLSEECYVADFTARPMALTRVIRISRESFLIVSNIARLEAEAEDKAEAARRAARRPDAAALRVPVRPNSAPSSREAASPRLSTCTPLPSAEPVLIELSSVADSGSTIRLASVADSGSTIRRGPSLGKLQLNF